MDDHIHLQRVFKVMGASMAVQITNICSLWTTVLLVSKVCRLCVLSTQIHKHDAFYEDWIWLDTVEDVACSAYASVE
jgi:hypothetical protein